MTILLWRKKVHYPQNAPEQRKYDCVHMADCYYCKYAYKYASEIVYGLSRFAGIRNKKKLKIMSVGCGPCTEPAAVDYLKKKGFLNYGKLQYRGIDPLGSVWNPIWDDIIETRQSLIKFLRILEGHTIHMIVVQVHRYL